MEGHVTNSVKTAKYNIITFLPIFLVEMFSRVAYLYFLAQVLHPLPLHHSYCSRIPHNWSSTFPQMPRLLLPVM